MNNLFIVDEELFDIRIDRYLSELLPDVSRSFIQKLLKNNEILLNDKPVKANFIVGDNLIETYESQSCQLDTRNVEKIIKTFLV